MVTINTSSVGATSRDYSSLGAWVTAKAGDLTSSDTIERAECYADADFAESPTISGFTCDATRYPEIVAADGERHDGTYGGSGAGGTTAVLFYPNSSGHVFTILDQRVRVGEGITVDLGTSHADSDEAFRLGDNSNNCRGVRIEGAIIWATDDTSNQDGIYAGSWKIGTSGSPVVVRNCLISGFTRCGIHSQNYGSSGSVDHDWLIVNCHVVDCGKFENLTGGIGWYTKNAARVITMKIMNTMVFDCPNAFPDTYNVGSSQAPTTTGSANNRDDDTTNPLPATTDSTLTTNTSPGAGEFVIVGTLWSDLTLIDDADNDALADGTGSGTDSDVPTVDFLGNPRPTGQCDLGPFEVTPTGTSQDPGVSNLSIAAPAGQWNVDLDQAPADLGIAAPAGQWNVDLDQAPADLGIAAPASSRSAAYPQTPGDLAIAGPAGQWDRNLAQAPADLGIAAPAAALSSSGFFEQAPADLGIAAPASSRSSAYPQGPADLGIAAPAGAWNVDLAQAPAVLPLGAPAGSRTTTLAQAPADLGIAAPGGLRSMNLLPPPTALVLAAPGATVATGAPALALFELGVATETQVGLRGVGGVTLALGATGSTLAT